MPLYDGCPLRRYINFTFRLFENVPSIFCHFSKTSWLHNSFSNLLNHRDTFTTNGAQLHNFFFRETLSLNQLLFVSSSFKILLTIFSTMKSVIPLFGKKDISFIRQKKSNLSSYQGYWFFFLKITSNLFMPQHTEKQTNNLSICYPTSM